MKKKLDCGCYNECDDMGHAWREIKKIRQEKRADNRDSSADILTECGVSYESKNIGAHLIVTHEGQTVDFWPGTGKWIARKGRKGRGVFGLLKYLGVTPKVQEPKQNNEEVVKP